MYTKFLRALVMGISFSFINTAAVAQNDSKAPEGAKAYIVSPADGAVVSSPVTVVFGLKGMGVAPAGANLENTGHHHLIIDAPLPDTAQGIPADDNHRHFGKGQTEATIELAPGEHTLQLLLGDWKHVPHDNIVASDVIKITVQ
ncbi:MAG: DUF4399 domain-containing protein [Acidiferrobacterales bacterium]|nr:DUF4399 domain-containing protein [Acidiferrobacterales bacterium]